MKAAIMGTGSWASSFGRQLAHKWDRVVLWGIEPEQVKCINTTGTNPDYLGDIRLPPNLRATLDLDDALQGAKAVFLVVPSQAVRSVSAQIAASSALPRRSADQSGQGVRRRQPQAAQRGHLR